MSLQAVLFFIIACLLIVAGVVILNKSVDFFFTDDTTEHDRRYQPATALWGLAAVAFGIALLYKLIF